jgi:hypothetical protein
MQSEFSLQIEPSLALHFLSPSVLTQLNPAAQGISSEHLPFSLYCVGLTAIAIERFAQTTLNNATIPTVKIVNFILVS